MSFRDIIKKSFFEGFSAATLDTWTIVFSILVACLIGLYIFLIYRIVTKKTFYSLNFNISLVSMAAITTAIILSIQVSVVVSLGMVGALSIVRFRTAIKEPLDLVFLFWSIGVGIMCGAGLAEIAIILSLIITIIILVLQKVPVLKAPMILVVNCSDMDSEGVILETVSKNSSYFKVKSRNLTPNSLNMVVELRTADAGIIVKNIVQLHGVTYASIMEHDGEVTV